MLGVLISMILISVRFVGHVFRFELRGSLLSSILAVKLVMVM